MLIRIGVTPTARVLNRMPESSTPAFLFNAEKAGTIVRAPEHGTTAVSAEDARGRVGDETAALEARRGQLEAGTRYTSGCVEVSVAIALRPAP